MSGRTNRPLLKRNDSSTEMSCGLTPESMRSHTACPTLLFPIKFERAPPLPVVVSMTIGSVVVIVVIVDVVGPVTGGGGGGGGGVFEGVHPSHVTVVPWSPSSEVIQLSPSSKDAG